MCGDGGGARDEHNRHAVDLKAIWLTTLERCAPEQLVKDHVYASMPRNVVAIGKCAGALLDGVAEVHQVASAFVAIPKGYRPPRANAEVHIGGHPQMTRASFAAGRALLRFVDAHDDILFLISGGGSACVEVPLAPHTQGELIETNARLVASGLPIGAINAERAKLSAIKGGRLGTRVRGRVVTFVYSDVTSGNLRDVASGPSDRNMLLVADNDTLTTTAAELIGGRAVRWKGQIECDVADAAQQIANKVRTLKPGEILVAGGEPTVVVKGDGRGGRCSELAVRFAMQSQCEALFASSDGVDGNSGAAGVYLPRRTGSQPVRGQAAGQAESLSWTEALERSDSFRIAAQIGEPIMIAPTGNNLRDLFLVARD